MTTYGLKYDKALSTTEIAKRLRQDVKAARENGSCPRAAALRQDQVFLPRQLD